VYVDEHGDDTSTTDTHGGDDQLTVEMDGEIYEVEENYDFDQDGSNDTAVVQTQDGYIAFADTDHDGTADVAVEFDHDGNVVAGAGYNESTHEWTEENPDKLPTPSGDGSHTGGHNSGGHDSGHPTDTSSHGHISGSEDIKVETPKGEFDAGQAAYDSDGDGTNDTAIVTDQDGTTYAFTDEDGDGKADDAVVIGADGHVTVAHNAGGDEWQVVDEGHLNSDGSYHSDSGGSDSVWADSAK
jgi:hypothetical protein